MTREETKEAYKDDILRWLKVIQNDRQYDFEFIYAIELRKIQRMIKWSDIL